MDIRVMFQVTVLHVFINGCFKSSKIKWKKHLPEFCWDIFALLCGIEDIKSQAHIALALLLEIIRIIAMFYTFVNFIVVQTNSLFVEMLAWLSLSFFCM